MIRKTKNKNNNQERKKVRKFIWGGLHPFSYHPYVFSFIGDLRDKTILDCGCGKGIYGFLIRVTRPLGNGKLIGIDTNENYLKFCRKFNIYDRLIKSSVVKLPLKNKSIDFIICSEVIEHLSKKDGNYFLDEVDRVCKERSIITTPNIYYQTHEAGEADKHRSIWSISDFRRRGYKVYGIGLKMEINNKDKYFKIKQGMSSVITPLSFLFPQISGSLICIKDFS